MNTTRAASPAETVASRIKLGLWINAATLLLVLFIKAI